MNLTIDNQLVTLEVLRPAWQEPLTVSLGDNAKRRIAESNELSHARRCRYPFLN